MFLPDEAWHVDAKSDRWIVRGRFMVERLESIDAIVERYCVASSPTKSRLYVGLGLLFVVFAIVGIWVPGWPTVSWAVPAAFLFSYSSESMFRWTLTNRFFGPAMFEYYATGKTIPKHAKCKSPKFRAPLNLGLLHDYAPRTHENAMLYKDPKSAPLPQPEL